MKISINCDDAFMAKYGIKSIEELEPYKWTAKHTRSIVNKRYAQKKKEEFKKMKEIIQNMEKDAVSKDSLLEDAVGAKTV